MSGRRHPLSEDERRDKKRKSVLKKIARLRQQHTILFDSQDTDPNCWQKMDTVRRKLIMYWDGYHRLG